MTIIKCKMCGGDIALSADKTFGTCEYCGCSMTFPKIENEQRAAAFNRGNHFRRIGEFDKALAVYEKIVSENEQDAEAHWCCALCRFGIEYVEDPNTMEWFPTCHRVSFDSFLEDVDYKAAVEYSEGITRRQYIKEGLKIAEVQKGILLTSQNTKPYDIFLCYKESDAEGRRTRDSLLAQEIYYQLTEQGRSVFFSRITLEDVAGTAYEPYIFAALNSAKVMIVVGTKPEYLNAPWVKNEWSRFLTLMKKDRSKLLLPCYRDMDPYDLPEQLGVLQSYDMSRIGFLPDLTRGISRVLENKPARKETVIVQQNPSHVEPLLRRITLFLEDGDWKAADEYCEKVLDMDPENAEAYLGKLLAEKHIRKKELLGQSDGSFVNSANYQKALRFGDDSVKALLESARKDVTYYAVRRRLSDTPTENQRKGFLKEILSELEGIPGWRDADTLAKVCRDRIRSIVEKEEAHRQEKRRQAEQQRREAERKAKKAKKTMGILLPAVCAVIAVVLLANSVVIPLLQNWDPKQAEGTTVDSAVTGSTEESVPADLAEAAYLQAKDLEAEGQLGKAAIAFGKLGDYKDSREKSFANWRSLTSYSTIAATSDCTVAIQSDGSVITAGEEFGHWYETRDWSVSAISAKGVHILGLQPDGTVVSEGWNDQGQREDVEMWTDIVAISAGRNHSVGLKSDGTAVSSGSNRWGNSYVKHWTDIVAVSAGHSCTIGLKKDGTVIYVGDNSSGQCDVDTWSDIVAVCTSGIHTVGLKSDGTVIATGKNDSNQCDVDAWSDIIAVSAGDTHTVGLKSDGTVVVAGGNDFGQCDVDTWTDIVAVCTGGNHTVGLKSDGTMVATGANNRGQCNVQDWKNIRLPAKNKFETSERSGSQQSQYDAAEKLLADDETAKAAIAFGKLGDYSDARQRSFALWNQVAVNDTLSAGRYYTVGVNSYGKVATVGSNDYGRLTAVSGWNDIVGIWAGWEHIVGLKSDGTVVGAGNKGSDRIAVSHWKDIQSLGTRWQHTVGLKTDGTVVAVGDNSFNQCDVSRWRDIVAVSAGWEHTVGLKCDGTVVTTGVKHDKLLDWFDIVDVTAGTDYTVGLKADGTVVAEGSNFYGQCDVSDWQDIIGISAGHEHTVGLKSDGTVVAVGSNRCDQCNVSDWRDIVAISAGWDYTVGLKSDGTVVAVGSNEFRQSAVKDWAKIKLPN